jgi:CBS domain-containing protein
MADVPAEIDNIARELAAGRPVAAVPVRTLLRWFGASRRGYWIVKDVKAALKKKGLATDPDFESAFIDAPIEFALREGRRAHPVAPATEVVVDAVMAADQQQQTPAAMVIGGSIDDPTYRIGKLEAANKPLTSIKPDKTLREAITLLLANDFSQLPVMTSERELKGVISWLSIGRRVGLGHQPQVVRDCMDQAIEISADRSLFYAISLIAQSDYVLVRAADNRITGIVTTADLSLQFRQLAEPFLLIGEIENHIRKLIDGKFTQPEIEEARNPADSGRAVTRVSDLTFGEYIRLLSEPGRWNRLRLAVDRVLFVNELELVARIRNDVMHFDPDGLPEEDLQVLRRVVRFLQQIAEVGLPG